jgi:hypothetical protein
VAARRPALIGHRAIEDRSGLGKQRGSIDAADVFASAGSATPDTRAVVRLA